VTAGGLRAAATAAAVVLMVACGKKGPPLPPLRPIPVRVADLTAVRSADRVNLRFTIPAANTDGTAPASVTRVDVYRMATVAGAKPPLASVITGDPDHLIARVAVRPPAPDNPEAAGAPEPTATPPPAGPIAPAAGDVATVADPIDAATTASGGARHYVVVPVAGSGRGRAGAASALLTVPIGALPEPPLDVTLAYDEAHVTAAWTAVTGEVFTVWRTDEAGVAEAQALTPEPIAQPTFSLPVQFGRSTCVSVRALQTTGAVRVEGPASAVRCVTPADRFPPAAPTGLRAVQEGTAVTLIWNVVEAADLGGYVVLRSEGATDALQPLMRAPIHETSFRDETVQPGATYAYAVYAVDTAVTPNVSQLSDRQTVTVR
jgi:hypothetical protein